MRGVPAALKTASSSSAAGLGRIASTLPKFQRLRFYLGSQTSHFVSKTVLVDNNNDVESAMKRLNDILLREGITRKYQLTQRYEKPTWFRNRVNFERAAAVYNEDMRARLEFIMRKNRTDPHPGANF